MEQVNLSKIAGKQASPHEGLICAALGKEQTQSFDIFLSTQYLFFSCCVSWEYSDPCRPSQGIVPTFAFQTLVSLSGSN